MAFNDLFGKRKACPLDQEVCKARQDNADALDGLLNEVRNLLSEPPRTEPVRLAPLQARQGAQRRH